MGPGGSSATSTATTTDTTASSTATTTTNTPTTGTSSPMVVLTTPTINSVISSPLHIAGKAKGGWFFEGSFPVKLVDANNKVLAQGPATAQGEWMTPEYVQFTADLTFSVPSTQTGMLILQNDNPSGLPENQQTVSIPVRFQTNTQNKVKISLYYQKVNGGEDPCSLTTVRPVERTIDRTTTPVQTAINMLLQGALTSAEKTAGYKTEFPNEDFKLKGANLKNGTLTLEFTEVPGFTTGGSCRVGLLKEEIVRTAMQFAGVNKVVFKPSTLFQP